jgi:hypothetical protein
MKLLSRLLKKSNFPQHKHDVVFAFTAGGVDYYQFKDFSNLPPVRGLKTMVFHEEMRMKCSLEYLEKHTEAVDNILTSQKINIYNLKLLNDQLKQRLEIALETELAYKLASIVFFDKKEDIRDYDFEYNSRKIEHWKKLGADAFFLLQPLQQLLPFLKDANENLNLYSDMVEKLNRLHWGNLSKLSQKRKIQKQKE